MMPVRWLLLFLMLLAAPIGAQSASPTDAIVRGTVTASTGQPLVYAVVSIPALDLQQFSNAQGKFSFLNIKPGTYRLSVRQLGYTAVNIEMKLSSGQNQEVAVKMERIVTKLPTMKVAADWPCTKPGRPTGNGDRQLIEVFEQLEQNAVRLKLLTVEFPFQMISERRRVIRHGDGLETFDKYDTVRTPSVPKARYVPGNVVYDGIQPNKPREMFLQIPTLLDFADSTFQNNHCFILAGIEETDGVKEVRVDFKPLESLKTPDVGGSVYLHPETFRLERSEIELSKVPPELKGLMRVHATTYFDDVVPGPPTIGEVIATSDLKAEFKMAPARAIERIVTLQVLFLKNAPDMATATLPDAQSKRGR